jgi:hypothetical protein
MQAQFQRRLSISLGVWLSFNACSTSTKRIKYQQFYLDSNLIKQISLRIREEEA